MRMNRCPLANQDPSIEDANRVVLKQQCVMLRRSNERIEIGAGAWEWIALRSLESLAGAGK